jgi:hypothetical protein
VSIVDRRSFILVVVGKTHQNPEYKSKNRRNLALQQQEQQQQEKETWQESIETRQQVGDINMAATI